MPSPYSPAVEFQTRGESEADQRRIRGGPEADPGFCKGGAVALG